MYVSIIANGSAPKASWLRAHLSGIVIAADGGANVCRKYGIVPDFIIGDFDSIERKTLNAFKRSSTMLRMADQDSTDLQKALALSKTLGARRTLVFGALGNNFDHAVANVLSLDSSCVLMDDAHIVHTVTRYLALSGKKGSTVSVIALSDVLGLSYSGLKWKAPRGMLPAGWIGVRNRMTGTKASVTLRKGKALVIQLKP